MSTINPSSVVEYVKDFECLVEGIEHFLKLQEQVAKQGSIDAIRSHFDENPEDKLCHVYLPGTREVVLCRRSGIDAIQRMALRLIAEAPNARALSAKRISEIISEKILQVAIDGVDSDEDLVQLLKSYVSESESEHVEASYHFPCVLLHCSPTPPALWETPPNKFSLGPVAFQRFDLFFMNIEECAKAGSKTVTENGLEIFRRSGEQFGWWHP